MKKLEQILKEIKEQIEISKKFHNITYYYFKTKINYVCISINNNDLVSIFEIYIKDIRTKSLIHMKELNANELEFQINNVLNI